MFTNKREDICLYETVELKFLLKRTLIKTQDELFKIVTMWKLWIKTWLFEIWVAVINFSYEDRSTCGTLYNIVSSYDIS